MDLSDYHATTGDWRTQLKKNERKTKQVIGTFFFIYVTLGLVVDVVLLQSQYPQATVGQCLAAMATFKVTPYATILLIAIAVISLMVTFSMYDKIMLLGTKSKQITPETEQSPQERKLYNVVEEMKVAAGMNFMPKIYIIEANYMNAFASGYSEKSAMVAITRGLLEKLDRAELSAVMAHELSHIRHHDIKLTLMVAVLSNILLIVIDILFYAVIFKRNKKGDGRLLLVIVVLRYVLPIITVMLALFLSRTREYMADAGCVELMRDNEPMARALIKISQDHKDNAEKYQQEYGETAHEEVRQAAYLYDPSKIDFVKSMTSAFSTHPSIESRLAAIGYIRKKK